MRLHVVEEKESEREEGPAFKKIGGSVGLVSAEGKGLLARAGQLPHVRLGGRAGAGAGSGSGFGGGGLVCALGPYVFSALGLVYLVPALLAPPPPVQSSLVTAAVTQVKQPGLFSACPLTRASQTESGNKIVGELVRARFRRPRERIEWCKKKKPRKRKKKTLHINEQGAVSRNTWTVG